MALPVLKRFNVVGDQTHMESIVAETKYAQRLGVEVQSLNEESARLYLPFKEENSNPGQALHGGVAASMINLGGLAVSAATLGEEAGPLHTPSIQVTYLAAAIGEPIVADATLLRRGKEICFVDVDVHTEAGKPVARGLCTVRGRFGAPAPDPVTTTGDNGASDPGPMGPALSGRVAFIGRLGLSVQNMAGGQSRISMPFIDANADAAGGVHEGAILAQLDTTGAMAAWSVTGPGKYKASTVGLQVQMVDRADGDDLIAYGRVVQHDGAIFWSHVEVATASTSRTVARGVVLYRIVVPQEK